MIHDAVASLKSGRGYRLELSATDHLYFIATEVFDNMNPGSLGIMVVHSRGAMHIVTDPTKINKFHFLKGGFQMNAAIIATSYCKDLIAEIMHPTPVLPALENQTHERIYPQ